MYTAAIGKQFGLDEWRIISGLTWEFLGYLTGCFIRRRWKFRAKIATTRLRMRRRVDRVAWLWQTWNGLWAAKWRCAGAEDAPRNTWFYRVAHWPIWIWVFFLAAGPLTFSLFAHGFARGNFVWLVVVMAGRGWPVCVGGCRELSRGLIS